jgi:hypothetical protein
MFIVTVLFLWLSLQNNRQVDVIAKFAFVLLIPQADRPAVAGQRSPIGSSPEYPPNL